jgi:hypothetical protein
MWDLISGGSLYSLDDLTGFVQVGKYDGLGMAQIEDFEEQGPQQHGNTITQRRLRARAVALELGMEVLDSADYWTRRDLLMRVFYPMQQMQLRLTLPNGDQRQIDVYTEALPIPAQDRNGTLIKTWATLKAPDPSFYSFEGTTLNFGVGAGSGGFVVPMPVPFAVGSSDVDQTLALAYDGSWLSQPHSIHITGPITDCVITNESTGEKLDFTGTTIAAGDYYEIDCRYRYKSVLDSSGVSRIDKLTGDSDLSTFHIAPHPDVPGGINSLRVTGSAANSNTEVSITFYTRYLGV